MILAFINLVQYKQTRQSDFNIVCHKGHTKAEVRHHKIITYFIQEEAKEPRS